MRELPFCQKLVFLLSYEEPSSGVSAMEEMSYVPLSHTYAARTSCS